MQIQFGDYTYEVSRWDGGDVVTAPVLGIDTETELITPGNPIMPVLLQVCAHATRQVQLVWWEDWASYLPKLLAVNHSSKLVFHNAPFDLEVLRLRDQPELVRAVHENRVCDMGIRYILRRMATGNYDQHWALDHVVERVLHLKVEKNEEFRLTFKQACLPTDGHMRYAAIDAIATSQLYEAMPKAMPTEQQQLVGFIALHAISDTGFLVDVSRMNTLRTEYEKQVKEHEWMLGLWGYYPGEPGNQAVKQQIMMHWEKKAKRPFDRTPTTKQISFKAKALGVQFAGNVPQILHAFAEHEHAHKMLTTYLKQSLIGTDGRVHPWFTPLVRTGRTSCSRPNIQNLPRKGGLREMYIAPPGHLLYTCDYKQLELCALAQTCHTRYRQSKMRELINSGVDLHVWFGKEIMAAFGGNTEDGIDYRQMAKAANFGLPGGLGAATFQVYASSTYGVILDLEQCRDLKELWLDKFPEMALHLQPPVDNQFIRSKGERDEQEDEEQAEALGLMPLEEEEKQEVWYVAGTISGRVRRRASYCSACNYPFQGLAADGAKLAGWYLYLERFRMVNFVHGQTSARVLLCLCR